MIKKLPDQNYVVLKFLVEFISLVVDRFFFNEGMPERVADSAMPISFCQDNGKKSRILYLQTLNEQL